MPISPLVGLSVDKSRKAMQIVCNDYYEDEVYLSKKEAMEAVAKYSGGEPPSKKLKSDKMKQVLPAAKTISNYKHMQASQV